MITSAFLRKAFPLCRQPDACAEALSKHMQTYEINTPARIAHFLAQIGHESGQLNIVKENLKYTAKRLVQVFPKYFSDYGVAIKYEGNPQKIASRVYANRMGNGPEQSGDGWKFCGRGYIQITGRNNYEEFERTTNIDVVNNPELLETPDVAALSACWFWSTRSLNLLADRGDVVGITKRINGGTHGLEERKQLLTRIRSLLG